MSHDSNGGIKKQIGDEKRYVNVFSLCRGPKSWSPATNPAWKLWLTNGEGEGKTWTYEDFQELRPGWHHFLIRWDHGRPLLELLIDGNSIVQSSDYRKYWPEEYAGRIFVGTWTTRDPVHFIETWIWRTILFFNFLGDVWLNRESAIARPGTPWSI